MVITLSYLCDMDTPIKKRDGAPLFVYIDPTLKAKLSAYASAHKVRGGMTQVTEDALKAFFLASETSANTTNVTSG